VAEVRDGSDPAAIAAAAALLRAGELVAFPTETVYGLGGDARSAGAAARIYAAKGRPSHNPLIVHVLDRAGALGCVEGWSDRADRLAEAFWPGPLTLVLARGRAIPAEIAGGGDTVAVRAPRHPVARALIAAFGGPIAAPSANRSSAISPTRADHVVAELGDRIALVLDGGACDVGLESTVVDLTGPRVRILRPGHVTASALAGVLGEAIDEGPAPASEGLRSPGMLLRHYAPRTPVVITDRARIEAEGPNDAVFLVRSGLAKPNVCVLPSDPMDYARELYGALRWADAIRARALWIEAVPEGEAWSAIRDRLTRAAAP